jgi:hypothetical protein
MATYLVLENGKRLVVKEGTAFPVTRKAITVNEIDSRQGSFSKTITIEGTNENILSLGALFDVNVTNSSFDINKKIKCDVEQEGVVVFPRCFFQLKRVIKKGVAVASGVDKVEFTGIVYNDITDFYKTMGNKEIRELQFPLYGTLDEELITDSWRNTADDVVVFPKMFRDDSTYQYSDFKPAIFYKSIFDRIFEQNGYTYTWESADLDTIQFSKWISPMVDKYEPSEQAKAINTVDIGYPLFEDPDASPIVDGVRSLEFDSINLVNSSNANNSIVEFFEELSNVNNNPQTSYNNTTGIYTAFLAGKHTAVIKSKLKVNFEASDNTELVKVVSTQNVDELIYRLRPLLRKEGLSPAFFGNKLAGSGFVKRFRVGDELTLGDNIFEVEVTSTVVFDSIIPNDEIKLLAWEYDRLVNGTFSTLSEGLIWDGANVQMKVDIENVNIQILPELNYQLGLPILPNDFLPKKVKQSDFIKSIMNAVNLIPEVDPDDDKNIILRRRDDYYDAGKQWDMSKRLARDKDFVVEFLPNVTSKAIELSYKDDKDELNEAYKGQTRETYGQLRFIFENENTKGIDRRELIFSPTPCVRLTHGAYVPSIPVELGENLNMRLLYYVGVQNCNEYTIGGDTFTTYPCASHLNDPINPSFDLNFGVARFYFYAGIRLTLNNLFNLHYRRLFNALNKGKKATAYINLTEADKQAIQLNDRIYINNSWWFIEEITFNANSRDLSKLVLFSVDDEVSVKALQTAQSNEPVNNAVVDQTPTITPPIFTIPRVNVNRDLYKRLNNYGGENGAGTVQGIGNTITSGVNRWNVFGDRNTINTDNAFVIGNDKVINESGLHVDKLFVQGKQIGATERVTLINSTNGNITVDANDFDVLLWVADFTLDREVQIDNFTPNKLKTILIVVQNTSDRNFTFKARNGVSGGYGTVSFVSDGDKPLTAVNVNSSDTNGARWLDVVSIDTNDTGESDLFIGKFN